MNRLTRWLTVLAVVVSWAFVLSVGAHGADLKVQCGGQSRLSSISAALKVLNPASPNTVTVSGTCTENVFVQGFNRLTLVGKSGAVVNDASGGTSFVVNIDSSPEVTLRMRLVQ